MLHRRVLLGLVMCLLAGCGRSATQAPAPAATVGKDTIGWAQVDIMTGYLTRFYQVMSPQGAATLSGCRAPRRTCPALERQALARLIEEAVVLRYALDHRIQLSAADRKAVDAQMQTLGQDPTGSRLLTPGPATRSVLRTILEREALVRKVEDRVSGQAASAGDAFHLRKYLIPQAIDPKDTTMYRAAERLATDGAPVPPATHTREEWVAPFRLSDTVRRALDAAQPGDFVGPFTFSHAYLVILLLGRGKHSYGKPARQALEAQLFHIWLQKALQTARPACLSRAGRSTPCPLPHDESRMKRP